MDLTHTQKESILKWAGYQKFGWPNWDMWQKPGLPIPEKMSITQSHEEPFVMPNFDSLDWLFDIIKMKCEVVEIYWNYTSNWYVRFLKLGEEQIATKYIDGLDESLVDAIQQALLKLIERQGVT